MVGAMKRWLKRWLGISQLEAENLRLFRAILALEKKIESNENAVDAANKLMLSAHAEIEDQEARLAFLEKPLTPTATSPKIVPKAHKLTFRQFAEVASRATEENTDG